MNFVVALFSLCSVLVHALCELNKRVSVQPYSRSSHSPSHDSNNSSFTLWLNKESQKKKIHSMGQRNKKYASS